MYFTLFMHTVFTGCQVAFLRDLQKTMYLSASGQITYPAANCKIKSMRSTMGCAPSSDNKGRTGTEYGQYSMLGNHHAQQTYYNTQNGVPTAPSAPTEEKLYHTDTEDEDENRLTPPPPLADPNKKQEQQVQKQETREPTPPPQEKKDPTPPPQDKREPTPQPQERKDPTPPPQDEREPTPQPQEKNDPTPPPPVCPPPEEDTAPPPPPENKEPSPPPAPDNNVDLAAGVIVKERTVSSAIGSERRGIELSSPEPPEFNSEYSLNDLGFYERHVEFRENPEEYDYEPRPQVQKGQLYVDEEFPLQVALGREYASRGRELEWKRPVEFAPNAVLFSDGTTRYDIGQGSIGTCWFLSSVSNIADKPKLIKRVIPKNSYPVGTEEYDGIFHCRFWRFGRWDDVYIDDFLPVKYGNVIYSARSDTDENEMWVSLLEKAFARMYGSYSNVSGGQAADSYIALTGGVPEDIKISEMNMTEEQLHSRIRNALKSGAVVTCTVPSDKDGQHGLVGGHEYSLTGAVDAKGTLLFRVRNPWGNTEWTGPWSDSSEQLRSLPAGTIPAPNKDDGEFYIALEHFLYYFSNVTICCITPDFDSDGNSDSLHYSTCLYGQWKGEEAAGFQDKIHSPKYHFQVNEDSVDGGRVPFVMQIIQRTKQRKKGGFSIRADIYKVIDSGVNDVLVLEEVGDPRKNNQYRGDTQVSFRHALSPGKYVCVPSTIEPGQEKDFMLRLYTAGPLQDIRKVDSDTVIMQCSGENADNYRYCQCISGAWIAGVNAGGQVSNQSFDQNPQFKVVVPPDCEQEIKFQLLAEAAEPTYPIGLKVFNLQGTEAPVNLEWLYENYGNATRTIEGDDGPFIQGHSAPAEYRLAPGTYLVLLHMDKPDTEKRFSLVIRSNFQMDIESYHLS